MSKPNMTPSHNEVLKQLFMNGPTWDGDIVSKQARDEIITMGLAYRANGGFTNITNRGIDLALEYGFGGLKISRKQV